MEKCVKKLNQLIENIGDNWKEVLDAFFKNENANLDADLRGDILDFIDGCKEDIISNGSASMQKIEKKIDNDLLYKSIHDYLDNILLPYNVFAPLRATSVKDADNAKLCIDTVFAEGIIRFNPNLPDRYNDFGFDNKDIFIDYLNVFDSMCSFTAEKNLYIDAIDDFIYDKTRLSKELCGYISRLLDSNMRELQIIYIIDSISNIKSRLSGGGRVNNVFTDTME